MTNSPTPFEEQTARKFAEAMTSLLAMGLKDRPGNYHERRVVLPIEGHPTAILGITRTAEGWSVGIELVPS